MEQKKEIWLMHVNTGFNMRAYRNTIDPDKVDHAKDAVARAWSSLKRSFGNTGATSIACKVSHTLHVGLVPWGYGYRN